MLEYLKIMGRYSHNGLKTRRCFLTISALFALAAVAVSRPIEASAEDSGSAEALQVLSKRCVSCHNAEKSSGGLDLTTRESAIEGGDTGTALVPGAVDRSYLFDRILAGEMPEGEALPKAEREVLRLWIAGGAEWKDALKASTRARAGGDWWSLQPIRFVAPPAVEGIPDEWMHSSIDRFVFARMAEEGLRPAPTADRRTLVRRATFDLTGLPPTVEEIDEFVNDPRPDAYGQLINRLLASPAYGERWGRHWLDVVRFGESNGYEQNHLRNEAWPFRDYVIRSFNEGKPFDQMVLEHLAGDQVAAGDPDVEVATSFLVAGPHDTVGNGDVAARLQARANDLDDMIMATCATFLALTANCARCHDHKFDPIKQTDYYRMQSVFAGVRHGKRPLEIPDVAQKRRILEQSIAEEVGEINGKVAALRAAAEPRIKERRESILAQYRPAASDRGTEETFLPVKARFLRMTIHESRGSARMDELEVWTATEPSRNVSLASLGATAVARATRTDNGDSTIYSVDNLIDGTFNKRWISGEGARGQVTIRLGQEETISRIFWSRDRTGSFQGKYAGSFPTKYEIEVSLDGESWKTATDSFDRLPPREQDVKELLFQAVLTADEKVEYRSLQDALAQANARREEMGPQFVAYAGRFQQPEEPTYLMKRGNPMSKGDLIPPASPSVLGDLVPDFELPLDAPEGERRLALARWIVHDQNPLTPRVLVNRLWHYHFGRGLVETPSDFGFNGAKPTHPALLEWLARRIQLLGWRLKPLHKEIMMSMTYRQSSAYNETHAASDSESRYLWRFRVRRLSAEEIRDTILAVSGDLKSEMGGPGFRLYKYTVDNVATYHPPERIDEVTYRRSVYHQSARSVKVELLGQYDCPDSSLPAPKREVTTTPLQALSLLNNEFIIDQARRFAKRVASEAEGDVPEQVVRAYLLTLGRLPDDEEKNRAIKFVNDHGLFLFCRALFNANEFVYVS